MVSHLSSPTIEPKGMSLSSSPRTPNSSSATAVNFKRPNNLEISTSAAEPVWVQTCLLEKHVSETVAGSQRRVSPSSARGPSRKSHRDSDSSGGGWGWLFGYASIDQQQQQHADKSTASTNSPGAAGAGGGQDRLRKVVPPPPSPSPSSASKQPNNVWNARNGKDSSRTLRIHDEHNPKYNQHVFTVSPQEYRAHVLPANVTNSSTNDDTNSSYTHFVPPKNLIELIHLHEPALVHSLNIRYTMDKVYTNCGPILLALNPFAHIQGLYGDEVIQIYRQCSRNTYDASSNSSSVYEGVEPHIYAIADAAFLSMQASIAQILEQKRQGVVVKRNQNNNNNSATSLKVTPMDQSILISGESGAGKTYNTKMAMRYLASISQHMASSSSSTAHSSPKSMGMEQQVLQSNPILESFGNARTLRNDNSSRFGKLIDIKFHYSGYILGASIDTYLLEKVRLVRQAPGERNYHIFYQLLLGMKDSTKRKELRIHGCTVQNFKITCMSGTFDRRDGVCDIATFKELLQAFDTVDFSSVEQDQLFHVITGLLHMSNLDFYECTGASDSSTVNTQNPSLAPVLHLFGVQIQALTQALCTCTLTVRGETMIKNLNLEKAEKAKEALMKASFGALFEYIVMRVNQSTATVGNSTNDSVGIHENAAHIKILDIFGFESFHVNSFEQLCINYCNEALQQQFNRFVFKMEQEEYEREGIEWSFIEFPDNQDILDLIERKHVGILSLLDEQCRLAKCSDQTFASATYEKCIDHPRFSSDKRQQASGLFQIFHYAGPVEYSTNSFLDKNKDELPREATDFLLSSSMQLLKELGQRLNDKNTTRSSQKSVGSQFSTQLRELRDEIDKTSPHYVRCLKPNDDLVAGNFVPEVVADQLRAAGVLEAVRVSRIGFPQRYKHDLFIQRYGLLASPSVRKAGKRARSVDYCSMLVQDLLPRVKGSHHSKEKSSSLGVQMGSTKVFLRQFAFDSLEKLRTDQLSSAAIKIQCVVRMFVYKTFYLNVKSAVMIIQSTYRMFMAKKIVRRLRRGWACVKIQSIWRGYLCFSDYSTILFAIVWAQRTFRGGRSRQLYRIMRREYKAITIQSWFRMTLFRKIFVLKCRVAFNVQQLFRCKRSKRILKELRIESRSLSNVVKERDQFREQILRMRKELEEAKAMVLESPKKVKAGGRHLLSVPQRDFISETASVVSSVCNESLIDEMVHKDREIELLRREIEYLKHSRFDNHILSMNASTAEISTTDISLLDNEASYRQRITLPLREHPHLLRDDDHMSDVSVSFDNHIHLAVHASDEDALSVAVSCADDLTCDLNQGGRCGRTPLHVAVMNSKLSIVQLLLENGCITNAQDDLGNTPLHYAKSELFIRVLLVKGQGNPNIPNNEGWCSLHYAVQRFDAESVRVLLSHGSKVNAADHANWHTPLHLLMLSSANGVSSHNISSKIFEITKLLCAQEAIAVDEQDKDGNTTLHYASTLPHDCVGDIIILLLQCGANPNLVNSRGQTPLHLLLHNRYISSFPFYRDLVLHLLKHGADVNIQTQSGCTPLHLAVYHREMDIAAMILAEGNGQLHIPWRKPETWKSHWDLSVSSSETFCLDMTQDVRILIHAIRCKQTFAPHRPCCMHCKSEFRGLLLRRQANCETCGSRVCSSCLYTGKVDSRRLPSHFNADSTSKHVVCKICEQFFISGDFKINL